LAFTKTFSMAAAALLSVTAGAGADNHLRSRADRSRTGIDQPLPDLNLSAGDQGSDARQDEVILRVTRLPAFRSVTGSSLVAMIRYLRT
jgi:hypothetical protein